MVVKITAQAVATIEVPEVQRDFDGTKSGFCTVFAVQNMPAAYDGPITGSMYVATCRDMASPPWRLEGAQAALFAAALKWPHVIVFVGTGVPYHLIGTVERIMDAFHLALPTVGVQALVTAAEALRGT